MNKRSNRARKNAIKETRMEIGKFLHTYYVKFGDEKYETFVENLGESMEREYGEPFSSDNLRIMEAEFVTFNSRLKKKNGSNKENTDK